MSSSFAVVLTLVLLRSDTPAHAVCESGKTATKMHHVNETNMTSVTVFVDRAEVARVLRLQLTAVGPFSVVLQGLPESIEVGSVRVEGEGEDLRISDVSDAANRVRKNV